ncbi:MAG: pectate lyase, partial [Sphingobacteriaceae bacterium]
MKDFFKISGSNVCMIACLLIFQQQAFSQKNKVEPPKPVFTGKDGKLNYTPDRQGNRIPDFSYAGYQAGNVEIPNVDAKIKVPLKNGDATQRIQQAIDYVANLPLNKDGFRGAVLLEKGEYDVQGQLIIKASGIVLRGSGMGVNGTILKGSGTDRQTLIRIAGINNIKSAAKQTITDQYVPVNAMSFHVAKTEGLKAGDQLFITRPSTKEWLDTTKTWTFGGGVSALGWKPGEEDITWDRKIISVKGNEITIDAPLTTALEEKFGGGTISSYEWTGRVQNIGVENLTMLSTFDPSNPKDENHRWMAITIENAAQVWVRQMLFKHFAGSAVNILASAKCVTVEDCKSLAPVSEIGGQRRYTFQTNGQQTLFQRLYSEYGYHDFAVGYLAAGPNAFVQCKAYLPFSYSGTIDTWASGVLFDIIDIDGHALNYSNIGQDGRGAGWTAANSVFWQCSASRVYNFSPPTAQNWAFGTW